MNPSDCWSQVLEFSAKALAGLVVDALHGVMLIISASLRY